MNKYTHIRARVDTKEKLQKGAKRAKVSLIVHLDNLADKDAQTRSIAPMRPLTQKDINELGKEMARNVAKDLEG